MFRAPATACAYCLSQGRLGRDLRPLTPVIPPLCRTLASAFTVDPSHRFRRTDSDRDSSAGRRGRPEIVPYDTTAEQRMQKAIDQEPISGLLKWNERASEGKEGKPSDGPIAALQGTTKPGVGARSDLAKLDLWARDIYDTVDWNERKTFDRFFTRPRSLEVVGPDGVPQPTTVIQHRSQAPIPQNVPGLEPPIRTPLRFRPIRLISEEAYRTYLAALPAAVSHVLNLSPGKFPNTLMGNLRWPYHRLARALATYRTAVLMEHDPQHVDVSWKRKLPRRITGDRADVDENAIVLVPQRNNGHLLLGMHGPDGLLASASGPAYIRQYQSFIPDHFTGLPPAYDLPSGAPSVIFVPSTSPGYSRLYAPLTPAEIARLEPAVEWAKYAFYKTWEVRRRDWKGDDWREPFHVFLTEGMQRRDADSGEEEHKYALKGSGKSWFFFASAKTRQVRTLYMYKQHGPRTSIGRLTSSRVNFSIGHHWPAVAVTILQTRLKKAIHDTGDVRKSLLDMAKVVDEYDDDPDRFLDDLVRPSAQDQLDGVGKDSARP